jgi:hypothetical protein
MEESLNDNMACWVGCYEPLQVNVSSTYSAAPVQSPVQVPLLLLLLKLCAGNPEKYTIYTTLQTKQSGVKSGPFWTLEICNYVITQRGTSWFIRAMSY